jgi:hypothetical protein
MDVVFFRDWIAYIVAKSVHLQKCIWRLKVKNKRVSHYECLYKQLISEWRKITWVVCDGRRWVIEYFKSIWVPVQKCHFHQQQTWKFYLWKKTKNKDKCILELKYIYEHLGKVDYEGLALLLLDWRERRDEYLKEKNLYGKILHIKVLKAYRSLLRNIPYLETHEVRSNLWIPTTTNGLDWWVFSWVKTHISIHRGLNDENLSKLIENYFSTH